MLDVDRGIDLSGGREMINDLGQVFCYKLRGLRRIDAQFRGKSLDLFRPQNLLDLADESTSG